MWEKVMKEVKLNRYAGPFTREQIPYDHYVQSPIGLVPKSGNKTRLIFHLSYDFPNGRRLINHPTLKELTSVHYRDLDHAIRTCLMILEKWGPDCPIFYSKSDLISAFRLLPIKLGHRRWLLMKAKHPQLKNWFYFIDKCLPFGSSISCAHFQLFSDALAAIFEKKLNFRVTNYLDDFLFVVISEKVCNDLLHQFIAICNMVNCPVSEEKTERASQAMIFLGILLDGKNHVLAVPQDKCIKVINLLKLVIEKRKVTINMIQKLTGLFNFLQRAIMPGCTFTRQLYNKLKYTDKTGKPLKQYHHIKVDHEVKEDCKVWLEFLNPQIADKITQVQLCRPFVDLDAMTYANTLDFWTDASKKSDYGFGCVFGLRWIIGQWPKNFIYNADPVSSF